MEKCSSSDNAGCCGGRLNDSKLSECTADMSELNVAAAVNDAKKSKVVDKRIGRGIVESGLTHECGVFGAIGCGEWPTQVFIKQK